MKNILLLLIVSICLPSTAQEKVNINIKIKLDTSSLKKYTIEKPEKAFGLEQVVLKVPFGEYEISNPEDAEVLNGNLVTSVDLVFTQYPVNEDFSVLNQKRVAMLQFAAPSIFTSNLTKWKLISQTGARNKSEAAALFHGFVITYRKPPSDARSKEESDYLNNLTHGNEKIQDSTVLKILERNENWQNMCIVGDFTSSMSPYTGQLLCWYALKMKSEKSKVKNFVFFNDGDDKPLAFKKIGETGGIYACTADNVDSVIRCAMNTIRNGTANFDLPENDVEALIYAQKKFPDAKELYLVADNWSNMRDYALISQVKKPVHVILCGAYDQANLQYIELAYQTKGSIHTMEEDLEGLFKKREGDTFELLGYRYRISGGKIVKAGDVPGDRPKISSNGK
jgi:hypothetical protein